MDIQLDTAPREPASALQGAGRSAPVAAQQALPAPKPPVSAPLPRAAAEQIAQQINRYLESSSVSVRFVVDSGSSKVVVRIIDPETEEVIRQIPSEELVVISRALEHMSGLLLNQRS